MEDKANEIKIKEVEKLIDSKLEGLRKSANKVVDLLKTIKKIEEDPITPKYVTDGIEVIRLIDRDYRTKDYRYRMGSYRILVARKESKAVVMDNRKHIMVLKEEKVTPFSILINKNLEQMYLSPDSDCRALARAYVETLWVKKYGDSKELVNPLAF